MTQPEMDDRLVAPAVRGVCVWHSGLTQGDLCGKTGVCVLTAVVVTQIHTQDKKRHSTNVNFLVLISYYNYMKDISIGKNWMKGTRDLSTIL